MNDDLSMLPADVRGALAEIAGEAVCRCSVEYMSRGLKDPACNHDLAESVETIRAELLRLARENAELHATFTAQVTIGLHQSLLRAEAELAKLRARIEAAPVVTVRRQIDTSGDGDTGKLPPCDDLPADYIGRRAALVKLEDEG